MDITGIEKLGDGVEPGNMDCTELVLFHRAIELQRWRDYYLLCDEKDYNDDKLMLIESEMLDCFYEWLLAFAVKNKSTFVDMSANTSGKKKSRNRRILSYSQRVKLGAFWPEHTETEQ